MNAKEEFLKATEGKNVKCCEIYYSDEDYYDAPISLPINFTNSEYHDFLNKLDFEYDDGWGMQYLEGYIWLNDGSWIERYEYDGSEGWTLKKTPPIPDCLQRNKTN